MPKESEGFSVREMAGSKSSLHAEFVETCSHEWRFARADFADMCNHLDFRNSFCRISPTSVFQKSFFFFFIFLFLFFLAFFSGQRNPMIKLKNPFGVVQVYNCFVII